MAVGTVPLAVLGQRSGMAQAGQIAVRQLIHQRDLRSACQHGAEVHISGGCAGERRCSGRNDLQTFQHPGGDGPPACLHAGHDQSALCSARR
jgi:hypothetical protein